MDRPAPMLPPLSPPARALLLGVAAGMRSQVPLAAMALQTERGQFDPGPAARRLVSSRGGVAGMVLAAGGELVADKLPQTPSRLSPLPFLYRLATGAALGSAAHYDANRPRALGAVLGAAGAGLGAAAGSRARVALAGRSRVPAVVWGLAEDVAAVGLAAAVLAAARNPG